MAEDTMPRVPTMDEITGVHNLPPPGYVPMPQQQPPIINRDSLVKAFIWAIPVIFTAGGLFVSVRMITERQDDQAVEIRAEQDRGTKLEADQRVMQGSVQSISNRQEKMETKLESIDGKLNEQRADLRAIGERIGARVSPSGGNRMTEPNP
jgi:hypothetical protein